MRKIGNESTASPTRNTSKSNVSLNSRKVVKLANSSKLNQLKMKDKLENNTNVGNRILTEKSSESGAMGKLNDAIDMNSRFRPHMSDSAIKRMENDYKTNAPFYKGQVWTRLISSMEGEPVKKTFGERVDTATDTITAGAGLIDSIKGLFGKDEPVTHVSPSVPQNTQAPTIITPSKSNTGMIVGMIIAIVLVVTIVIVVMKKRGK